MATVNIGYSTYCTTNTCKVEEWIEVSKGPLSAYETDEERAKEAGLEIFWPYFNINKDAKGNDDRILIFRKLCPVCTSHIQLNESLQQFQVKEVLPDISHGPAQGIWVHKNDLYIGKAVSFNLEEFAQQVEGGLGPDMQFNKGGQFADYDPEALKSGAFDEAYLSDEDPLAPGANEPYETTKRAAKLNEAAQAQKWLGKGAPDFPRLQD